MVKKRKLLKKVISGSRNIRFSELTILAEAFGFELVRTSGGHHIFSHPDIPELINLQNADGKAKPYQVRQLQRLVERYNLELEVDDE